MSSYYIEPTSEQLFHRYNGTQSANQQEIYWIPVVVTVGFVALIGIGIYVNLKKANGDISQLGRQYDHLSRVSIINEHALNKAKEDVSINAKSIDELRREVRALKLQAELNNTLWC